MLKLQEVRIDIRNGKKFYVEFLRYYLQDLYVGDMLVCRDAIWRDGWPVFWESLVAEIPSRLCA